MWQKLWQRWFGKRKQPERPNRFLFEFFNGTTTSCADPIVVYRKLMGDPRDLIAQFVLLDAEVTEDKDRDEAHNVVANIVCDALGIKLLARDGEGVTESEAIEICRSFFQFIESVKKKQPI